MQAASWYWRRLRMMSAGEVAWRVESALRDWTDIARVHLDRLPRLALSSAAHRFAEPSSPLLSDVRLGAWQQAAEGSPEAGWCRSLRAEADALLGERLRIFGREVQFESSRDRWNRDHFLAIPTPMAVSPQIDYRDVRVSGDAKVVWEPNRHQHLVVLARAYRATADPRYADAVTAQLADWMTRCPFGRGMNWRSPLELALRAINWVWAMDLLRGCEALNAAFCERWLHVLHLHVWDIARKFSRGSSANNHLIGEAAGVFIACCYLPDLDPGERLRQQSQAILCREIDRQTTSDGCSREHAFTYQLFVLELLLLSGLVGRRFDHELPAPFWRRLESMVDFMRQMTDGGPLPAIGDSDDGYVLDLGQKLGRGEGLMAVGAAVFGRADFKARSDGFSEAAHWLLGSEGEAGFAQVPNESSGDPLESVALPESGYYLLQSGRSGSPDCISVVFDCAPLGLAPLAAHGHADALSLVVRAFGVEVLTDPGTYDYFTFPEWRTHFRSTSAHNTVTLDGLDQSTQAGLFLWSSQAHARCLSWQADSNGARVAGEHDGYLRLADPARHRRSLHLDAGARQLSIDDHLEMVGDHTVALWFHFAEHCVVTPLDEHRWDVQVGVHVARLTLDPRLRVVLRRGSEQPRGGWVSRGYHSRQASPSLHATLEARGAVQVTSRLEFVPGTQP